MSKTRRKSKRTSICLRMIWMMFEPADKVLVHRKIFDKERKVPNVWHRLDFEQTMNYLNRICHWLMFVVVVVVDHHQQMYWFERRKKKHEIKKSFSLKCVCLHFYLYTILKFMAKCKMKSFRCRRHCVWLDHQESRKEKRKKTYEIYFIYTSKVKKRKKKQLNR